MSAVESPPEKTRPEPPPKGEYRNVFAWNDDSILDRADRLALVARALCLLDILAAMEQEQTGERWMTAGISSSVASLVKAGDLEGACNLLVALETLVPQSNRDEWPLVELTESR